jgi:hypothetical protein
MSRWVQNGSLKGSQLPKPAPECRDVNGREAATVLCVNFQKLVSSSRTRQTRVHFQRCGLGSWIFFRRRDLTPRLRSVSPLRMPLVCCATTSTTALLSATTTTRIHFHTSTRTAVRLNGFGLLGCSSNEVSFALFLTPRKRDSVLCLQIGFRAVR